MIFVLSPGEVNCRVVKEAATDYCGDLLFPCTLRRSWTASMWTCWLERARGAEGELLFQPGGRRRRRIEELSVGCWKLCRFHKNKYCCQESHLVYKAIVQHNVQRNVAPFFFFFWRPNSKTAPDCFQLFYFKKKRVIVKKKKENPTEAPNLSDLRW